MKYSYQKNQLTDWKDGYFIETGNKHWVEFQEKDTKFHFIEKKRDRDFIYLFGKDRNIWVSLPIEGGVARYRWDNDRNWTQLYNVHKEHVQVTHVVIPTPEVLPFGDDVVIHNTRVLKAARLVNFPTNTATLQQAHRNWIINELIPAIHQSPNPWIDLYGYASKKGSQQHNLMLSRSRTEAVKKCIGDNLGPLNKSIDEIININVGFGENDPLNLNRESEVDDSSYWRSVEVFMFGSKPRVLQPPHNHPPTPSISANNFEIRVVGGGSAAVAIQADDYIFQIVDLVRRKTAFYFYTGVGLGISIPKIPGPWGSYTKTGPTTSFKTSKSVQLYQFNSMVSLYQDPGVALGYGIGGMMRLTFKEIHDPAGIVRTNPRPILIEGGSGIQMPGLGSATEGFFILMTPIWPFTGY